MQIVKGKEVFLLRALQSELTFDDGIALLDSMPFSGLAFATDESRAPVHVTFAGEMIACKVITGWQSYSNGKAGGEFKPDSLEQKYGPLRLLTLDAFPDEAQNFDAALNDGSPLNGIVYDESGREWEARTYVAGHQDLQLIWAKNGTLVYALCYGPVREVLQWYENGAWKECRISPNDAPGTAFGIALQANRRATFLAIRNWKAAVTDPRRRTSFQFAAELEDILAYRADQCCTFDPGPDFIEELPLILKSGFFDDTEVIHWIGGGVAESFAVLFEHLAKRNFKELHMEFEVQGAGEFALALKQKMPQVKITGWVQGRLKAGTR